MNVASPFVVFQKQDWESLEYSKCSKPLFKSTQNEKQNLPQMIKYRSKEFQAYGKISNTYN